MISKVYFGNYRSFESNASIDLANLSVLVGPNGAGKSNLVDALRFLSDSASLGLEAAVSKRHGINAVRRWSRGRPFNVELGVDLDLPDVRATYRFIVASTSSGDYRVKSEAASVAREGEDPAYFELSDGNWKHGPPDLRPAVDRQNLALQLVGGDSRFRVISDALRGITLYTIFPDKLRGPQRYSPSRPMDEHGGNWVSILKDQDSKTWKPELVEALSRLTGGDIVDIEPRNVSEFLVARFRHDTAYTTKVKSPKVKWFDSSQESDGTLRVAGILTALLQEPPLPLVGIEEPELTVFPGAIPLLMDFIQQASKKGQVILTTHSPEVLDRVRTSEIRVVKKVGETSSVGPLSEGQLEAVKDGLYSLGDFQRTDGLEQRQIEISQA